MMYCSFFFFVNFGTTVTAMATTVIYSTVTIDSGEELHNVLYFAEDMCVT